MFNRCLCCHEEHKIQGRRIRKGKEEKRAFILKEKKKRAATIAVKVVVTRPMSPMCYNTLLLDHVLQHSSPGDTIYTHTHAIHTKHIHNNTVPTSTSNCLFTYKFTNSRSEKIFFYCHYTCSTLFIIFFLRISRNLLK